MKWWRVACLGMVVVGVAPAADAATAASRAVSPATVYATSVDARAVVPIAVGASTGGAPIAAFGACTENNVDWSFDASASVAPSSPIVKYRWRFGDGAVQTAHTPLVTHNYTTSGRHKVVLTETDAAGTSTTQVFTGQTMLRNGSRIARAVHFVTVL